MALFVINATESPSHVDLTNSGLLQRGEEKSGAFAFQM